MAKKKDDAKAVKKDAKKGRTDSVRAAVDQAFSATAQATADAGQLTRDRATDIADEVVGNLARLREALDDARPATAEDVKALRADVAALAERLDRLEAKPSARASASRTAAAKRTTAAARAARPAGARPKPVAPVKRGAAGKGPTAPGG